MLVVSSVWQYTGFKERWTNLGEKLAIFHHDITKPLPPASILKIASAPILEMGFNKGYILTRRRVQWISAKTLCNMLFIKYHVWAYTKGLTDATGGCTTFGKLNLHIVLEPIFMGFKTQSKVDTVITFIDRPGVAGAVLQTASLLINSLTESSFS